MYTNSVPFVSHKGGSGPSFGGTGGSGMPASGVSLSSADAFCSIGSGALGAVGEAGYG